MDPVVLLSHIVDDIGQTQCFGRAILPMVSGRPIVFQKGYCRWPRAGPVLLVSHIIDGIGWAQCVSQWKPPMTLNGPSVATQP
jgi:hypothetical protein